MSTIFDTHNHDRRSFITMAGVCTLAAACGLWSGRADAADATVPWGTLSRVDAGDLSIEYADIGPRTGAPVLLLHGWPYDIHSFAEVAPMLAAKGHRVIIPYLLSRSTSSR